MHPYNSDKKEHPSTYIVQDRNNEEELQRLDLQARLITAATGGVLSEQTDTAAFRRILDVACATGYWIIEASQAYPDKAFTGIDISRRMIEYAGEQAKLYQISDRVEFQTMDALRMLEFSSNSFDLANMRCATSFLRTWDWPKIINELLRVTRPGGVIRLTEVEIGIQCNSDALTGFFDLLIKSYYHSGHLFTQERSGLAEHLPRLLAQYGAEQVQKKFYTIVQRAGTPAGQGFCEDCKFVFQTTYPFIQKWGGVNKEAYQALCQQAIEEMDRPDFQATTYVHTIWGHKPE